MLYPKPALDAILSYGYTPTQAEFLWLAATFSGHFFQRQYQRFAQTDSGSSTRLFISRATGLGHVREYEYQANLRRYHVYSRPFYMAIGQANNNHRRSNRSLTNINQKLATLDYVIDHQDYTFLSDEADRLAHFQQIGVQLSSLPCKTYPATTPGKPPLTHYFVDKFPLAIAPQHVLTYVDEYSLTLPSFETHLRQYLAILRGIPAPLTFCFISPVRARFVDAERLFARVNSTAVSVALAMELERYFRIKRALIEERWADLQKQDYVDKPALEARFETPDNAALYLAWKSGALPQPPTSPATPMPVHFEVYAPPSLPEPREYVGSRA